MLIVTQIMITIIIIFVIGLELLERTDKQRKILEQLETEKNELPSLIEQEKIEREMIEKEKNESLSHLEQQKKRSEQLEREQKQLLFQLEEERKELQPVSGNYHRLSYIYSFYKLSVIC